MGPSRVLANPLKSICIIILLYEICYFYQASYGYWWSCKINSFWGSTGWSRGPILTKYEGLNMGYRLLASPLCSIWCITFTLTRLAYLCQWSDYFCKWQFLLFYCIFRLNKTVYLEFEFTFIKIFTVIYIVNRPQNTTCIRYSDSE